MSKGSMLHNLVVSVFLLLPFGVATFAYFNFDGLLEFKQTRFPDEGGTHNEAAARAKTILLANRDIKPEDTSFSWPVESVRVFYDTHYPEFPHGFWIIRGEYSLLSDKKTYRYLVTLGRDEENTWKAIRGKASIVITEKWEEDADGDADG